VSFDKELLMLIKWI